jgi:Protein of unknown function (DUF3106)
MRLLFANTIVVMILAGSVSPAAAQDQATKQSILRQKARRQQRLKQLKQRELPLPAPAVQRFLQMSPEDQERALSRLPPERRQQMEQRLNRLQQLPPEQRQQLQDLYPAFTSLRPERRQAVRQEIELLRRLRPAERKDRLNGDAGDFSPEEMDILRQVTGIRDGQ